MICLYALLANRRAGLSMRRSILGATLFGLVGFGPDGIVVTGEDALRAPADDHEKAVVGGDLDLDCRLVLGDVHR